MFLMIFHVFCSKGGGYYGAGKKTPPKTPPSEKADPPKEAKAPPIPEKKASAPPRASTPPKKDATPEPPKVLAVG
jgi:hypothetical protein